METFNFVYITTNLINGKQYIGDHSTTNLKDNYLGSGRPYFKNALNEYGRENFKREILEFFDTKEEAFSAQEKYIQQYNTLVPNGYNISPRGGNNISGGISEEGKRKISIKNLGKKRTEKQKNNMREAHIGQKAWNKGLKSSPETINKWLEKMIGRKQTEEEKEKRAKSLRGKKRTEEQRKNMSESAKKRKASDETKKILSDSHKGKSPGNKGKKMGPRSEEVKKRISEKLKGIKRSKQTQEHKDKIQQSRNRNKIK